VSHGDGVVGASAVLRATIHHAVYIHRLEAMGDGSAIRRDRVMVIVLAWFGIFRNGGAFPVVAISLFPLYMHVDWPNRSRRQEPRPAIVSPLTHIWQPGSSCKSITP
jgi:hypothetical protein